MAPPSPRSANTLVVRREFAAPRERVFRAWIEPEALERWLRPKGTSMTVSSLDARVGGSFRFDVEDGHSVAGTYLQIVPPERLVFTWSSEATQGRETVVTVDFIERGSATEVVLTHEGLGPPELRELHEAGWRSLLDALAGLLSSRPASDAPFD